MNDLNPPIVISKIKFKNKLFYIVRDDVLVGGTKQRMLEMIIKNSPCTEFVYAGPVTGFAQIALSYVANILNKDATLFLNKVRPMYHLTKFASKFSPKIIEKNTHLKDLQNASEKYVETRQKEMGKNYVCLLPFGLKSKKYVNHLAKQIKIAWVDKNGKPLLHPKRIWLVAGSATILNSLYIVFPNTFFNVVQVGKTIWPDQMDLTRSKLYISDERFYKKAIYQPPYPTVATYDAKLWKYVVRHGISGDYIWNVGADK